MEEVPGIGSITGECANGIVQRHTATIGRVQLVEIDALHPQPPETALAGGAKLFRPAVGFPAARSRAHEAALGGNHDAGRVRVQEFRNQALVDVGAVGIRRVYEIDTELQRPAQHATGRGRNGGSAHQPARSLLSR